MQKNLYYIFLTLIYIILSSLLLIPKINAPVLQISKIVVPLLIILNLKKCNSIICMFNVLYGIYIYGYHILDPYYAQVISIIFVSLYIIFALVYVFLLIRNKTKYVTYDPVVINHREYPLENLGVQQVPPIVREQFYEAFDNKEDGEIQEFYIENNNYIFNNANYDFHEGVALLCQLGDDQCIYVLKVQSLQLVSLQDVHLLNNNIDLNDLKTFVHTRGINNISHRIPSDLLLFYCQFRNIPITMETIRDIVVTSILREYHSQNIFARYNLAVQIDQIKFTPNFAMIKMQRVDGTLIDYALDPYTINIQEMDIRDFIVYLLYIQCKLKLNSSKLHIRDIGYITDGYNYNMVLLNFTNITNQPCDTKSTLKFLLQQLDSNVPNLSKLLQTYIDDNYV